MRRAAIPTISFEMLSTLDILADMGGPTTRTQSGISSGHATMRGVPEPGLLLIFSSGAPRFTVLPLAGGELVVGRHDTTAARLNDHCMSRQHARVTYDGALFWVLDLGSRNGTAVDGERATASTAMAAMRVVRMGESLFLPVPDLRPFHGKTIEIKDGHVRGPALQQLFRTIAQLAGCSSTLHIAGESGAGKEAAARAFHELGPVPNGPFIAVNCATIPAGVAERLLFGARRGAYSGANHDVDGYVQAADGGTLFLDEVAELELSVQAKLLRVLENKEVLALGASHPRKVQLRVCSASHKDLRAQVGSGGLREDLYFRLGRPEVKLPPLRERREEIPWLIEQALNRARPELGLHVSLVEVALLRPWPGNVRELLNEIRAVAQVATASSSARADGSHLGEGAGTPLSASSPVEDSPVPVPPPTEKPARRRRPEISRDAILEALRSACGNISAAARSLGVHRTQLRRLLTEHAVDAQQFASAIPADEEKERKGRKDRPVRP